MNREYNSESDVLAQELNERLQRKVRMRTLRIWLIGAAIVLAILTALAFFLMKMFFSVKEVTLKGDVDYPVEEILKASKIEKGDLLLFIDRSKAEKGILQRFVMIERVTIEREAPDRVVFTIKNEVPYYYFVNEGLSGNGTRAYAVVAKSQKILEILGSKEKMTEKYGELPRVDMPDLLYAASGKKIVYKDESDGDYIPELLELIAASSFSSEDLTLDARVRFDIVFYSGKGSDGLSKYEVRLGNKQKIADKIAFAQSIALKIEANTPGFEGMICVDNDDVKKAYAVPRTQSDA